MNNLQQLKIANKKLEYLADLYDKLAMESQNLYSIAVALVKMSEHQKIEIPISLLEEVNKGDFILNSKPIGDNIILTLVDKIPTATNNETKSNDKVEPATDSLPQGTV